MVDPREGEQDPRFCLPAGSGKETGPKRRDAGCRTEKAIAASMLRVPSGRELWLRWKKGTALNAALCTVISVTLASDPLDPKPRASKTSKASRLCS